MFQKFIFPVLMTVFPVLISMQIGLGADEVISFVFDPAFMVFFVCTVVFFFSQYKNGLLSSKTDKATVLQCFFRRIADKAKGVQLRISIWKPIFNLNPAKGTKKFFRRCLVIEYGFNINGLQHFWVLPVGFGIVGNCYALKRIIRTDFSEVTEQDLFSWGLDSVEAGLLKNLKGVIGIPICDDVKKYGVFKIESDDIRFLELMNDEEFIEFIKDEIKNLIPLIRP